MSNVELLKLIQERDNQLQEAQEKIYDLEEQLARMISLSALSGTEKVMLDIIGREVSRIGDNTKDTKLTKDDLRAFDVLVKDFVAIRGKIITEKPKEQEELEDNVENLILLATADE
jgi:hypothetical protein